MADKRERAGDSGNVYPKKKYKSGTQKRREHDNKLLLESAKNVKPLTSFFKPTASSSGNQNYIVYKWRPRLASPYCLAVHLAFFSFIYCIVILW